MKFADKPMDLVDFLPIRKRMLYCHNQTIQLNPIYKQKFMERENQNKTQYTSNKNTKSTIKQEENTSSSPSNQTSSQVIQIKKFVFFNKKHRKTIRVNCIAYVDNLIIQIFG